jgi:hypothetical protein
VDFIATGAFHLYEAYVNETIGRRQRMDTDPEEVLKVDRGRNEICDIFEVSLNREEKTLEGGDELICCLRAD